MSESQLKLAHFFEHVGGLNTTDSPFKISDGQTNGALNYDYALTGGFHKRDGHPYLNTIAYTSRLRATGLSLSTKADNTKVLLRAGPFDSGAGDLARVNVTTGAAGSTITVDDGSTANIFSTNAPVNFSQFNTTSSNTKWLYGGGLTQLYGYVQNEDVLTKNGQAVPGGSISLSQGGSGGVFLATGVYYYAVSLIKRTTLAQSNATLDKTITLSAITNKVTVDLSSVTGITAGKVQYIYIYRSAVSGASAFTTGDLIAQVDVSAGSATTYVDDGTYISTAQNVPRVGNTILDNAVPVTGAICGLTTFKRRLVYAIGSTIYFSDINKPESWPGLNIITIPSGGSITGLAVVSFTTPTSSSIDEFLVIFKDTEVWVVTGSSISDYVLKFIDNVGCVGQATIANAQGLLCWIDYTGIYVWDGSGKPIYASRPIESMFQLNGDFDKTNFQYAWGAYYKSKKQVMWALSHNVIGTNQVMLKLDLRLTLPQISGGLGARTIDGVFAMDTLPAPFYAGTVALPSTDEVFFAGDNAGHTYSMFSNSYDQTSTGIAFQYGTKFFDLGSPGTAKRFHKVIVWARDTTDADLTLNYWTKYHSGENDKAGAVSAVSNQVSDGSWDVGAWDAAYWDDNAQSYNPIVFNLGSALGNEGDCIRLRFSNSDANAAITIAGFTIVYSEAGLRK